MTLMKDRPEIIRVRQIFRIRCIINHREFLSLKDKLNFKRLRLTGTKQNLAGPTLRCVLHRVDENQGVIAVLYEISLVVDLILAF